MMPVEGVGVLRVLSGLVEIGLVGRRLDSDPSGVDGKAEVCSVGAEAGRELGDGLEAGTLGVLWGPVDIVGRGLESVGRGVCCWVSVMVVVDSGGVGKFGFAPSTVNVANLDISLSNPTGTVLVLKK